MAKKKENPTPEAEAAKGVGATQSPQQAAEAGKALEALNHELEGNSSNEFTSEEVLAQKDAQITQLTEINSKQQKVIDELSEKLANNTLAVVEQNETGVVYTSASGDVYQIDVPEFRFRGNLYKSAEAVEKNRDVLEQLIEAKSFILKRK